MKNLYTLITAILLFSGNFVFGQDLVYRQYTIDDGLPHSNVFRLFQDSKGFIWIGTELGLCRFDGKRFERFEQYEPIQDRQILGIIESRDSTIWINTYDGRLHTYKDGAFKEYVPVEGELPHSLLNLILGKRESLFSTTNLSYVRIGLSPQIVKEFTFDEIHSNFTPGQPNIYCVYEYGNQDKLLGTDIGIIKVSNGIAERHFQTEINEPVYCIEESNDNHLNCGSDGKIYIIQGESVSSYIDLSVEKVNKVQHIKTDRWNNLWISGEGSDLIKVGRNGVENYSGLVDNLQSQINDVIIDSTNNVWVSTFGSGVFTIPIKQSKPLYIRKIHKGKYVHSIGLEGDSNVILGCYDAVYLIKDSGKALSNDTLVYQELFSQETIDAVAVTLDSKILVSHHPNSLTTIDYGRLVPTYDKYEFVWQKSDSRNGSYLMAKDETGIDSSAEKIHRTGTPLQMYPIENNQIICVFWDGIYSIQNNEIKECYELPTKLKDSRVLCINYNEAGRTLIGTEMGLILLNDENYEHHTVSNGLPSNVVRDILQAKNGVVWIATDNGVARYCNGEWLKYTQSNGLSHRICTALAMDANHNIWVGTKQGLNCITASGVVTINKQRGLISDEILSLQIDNNENLWVGTAAGASVVVPTQFTPAHTSTPETYITRVNSYDKVYLDPDSITLPHDSSKFVIDFVGLNYEFPEGVQFQYKLENVDADWNYTRKSFKEYTNLSPGNYTFILKSKIDNSDWSKRLATLNIHIIPPFWQRLWFQLAVLSVGMLVSSVVVLALIRAKNKRTAEKQQLLVSIAQLQQQALNLTVNPHFLFNALTSIQHFFNTDKTISRANIYLSKFSKLVRLILDDSLNETISLEDEVNRLGLYFELEKMRLGKRFEWHLEVDVIDDPSEIFIPVMIIQPYVENAIWHGIYPLDGNGEVRVKVWNSEPETLRISISDNGLGINNDRKDGDKRKSTHKSHGLRLTKQRMELHVKTGMGKISVDTKEFNENDEKRPGTVVDITVSL